MPSSIAHNDIADRDETEAALRLVDSMPTFVPPLDIARRSARSVLDEALALDLDTATIGEAYGQRAALMEALREVLAALDTEEGRRA